MEYQELLIPTLLFGGITYYYRDTIQKKLLDSGYLERLFPIYSRICWYLSKNSRDIKIENIAPSFIIQRIWLIEESKIKLLLTVTPEVAQKLKRVSTQSLALNTSNGRYLIEYKFQDQTYLLPCEQSDLDQGFDTDAQWLSELDNPDDFSSLSRHQSYFTDQRLNQIMAMYAGPYDNFYSESRFQVQRDDLYDLDLGEKIMQRPEQFIIMNDLVLENELIF